MSHVAVEKIKGENQPLSLLSEAKALSERIRERAFELFQLRGRKDGSSLEDWLQAEREVVQIPESNLVEKDGKFEVQIAIPGFDAKDVRVTATPRSLFVDADVTSQKHEKVNGNVYFSEFGEKKLFRRLDLPEEINVDSVTTHLEKGVLHVTAPRKEAASETLAVEKKAAASAA